MTSVQPRQSPRRNWVDRRWEQTRHERNHPLRDTPWTAYTTPLPPSTTATLTRLPQRLLRFVGEPRDAAPRRFDLTGAHAVPCWPGWHVLALPVTNARHVHPYAHLALVCPQGRVVVSPGQYVSSSVVWALLLKFGRHFETALAGRDDDTPAARLMHYVWDLPRGQEVTRPAMWFVAAGGVGDPLDWAQVRGFDNAVSQYSVAEVHAIFSARGATAAGVRQFYDDGRGKALPSNLAQAERIGDWVAQGWTRSLLRWTRGETEVRLTRFWAETGPEIAARARGAGLTAGEAEALLRGGPDGPDRLRLLAALAA